MKISTPRSMRTVVPAACAVAALVVPAAASGLSVTADLRVEAGGKTLASPGSSFVTDTYKTKTDTSLPACAGSGKSVTVEGPTALGLLGHASEAIKRLRPVAISDRFSFGLLVCGVGGFMSDATSFWLYKVDHKSPEVGGDQLALTGGEEVLWYRQTLTQNTGDELVLKAPARAKAGRSFAVTVSAYDFAGEKTPAAGAVVKVAGASATTDAAGRARVTVGRKGTARLSATRGMDIPTGVVNVCVGKKLSDCPAARGKRIYGTKGADPVKGTRGPDVIRTGAGKDTIDVRRGGKDVVRCGKGRDRVRSGRGDRVARDCEVVNGKRQNR